MLIFSVGGAGTGKTTSARIFANKINNNQGTIIEIDGASNNGTEQMRKIIDDAKFKPLDSKYKCFIIDECHSISNQRMAMFIKIIRRTTKNSYIFILHYESRKNTENNFIESSTLRFL